MKKGIKIVLILAAVFLLLGVVLCIVSLSLGADPVKLVSDGTYTININKLDDLDDIFDIDDRFEADREGSFGQRPGSFGEAVAEGEDSYSVGGDIKKLEIDWVSGNVKIVRGEGESITFSESDPDGIDADDRLFYELSSDVLKISCCNDDTITIGININSGCGNKELVVTVPYELNDIYVDTTSADVVLEGLGVKDGIRASTTSGDIIISGAGCEKGILSTTSGNIDFNGSCKNFAADAVSGRISFIGSCRDFEADSTSGKVEAEFADTPNEISADTVSGAVELALPSNAAFELEFDTVSGGFECDFAVRMHEGDYVAGQGGAEMDVDTVSGGLKIKSK